MPSRKLEDLHPVVAEKARALLALAEAEGIELLITSALRTFEEQAALYAIGRTKPGKRVTNAKPGQSWHNFGLAFDVVPLVNGKAIWNSPFWSKIGELGRRCALQWGGDFKSFKDLPHFEYHPNLTLAEANWRKREGQELLG
ncbi:MAG: M15 family metallopeptidase [Deltaproteobacteria bacterium]